MILERVTANKAAVAEDLILIWEDSCSFFPAEKIAKLKPLVKLAIKNMQTLLIAKEKNRIIGFLALENKKIEMLFIQPDFWGKGIGKALVFFAIEQYHATWVDVSEQNGKALAFYKHIGFSVFSDSKTNTSFPILHMKWEQK
mgnify:CR=1 FL=1